MKLLSGYINISITAILLAGASLFAPPAVFADDVPLSPGSFRANDGVDRYTFSWSKVGRTGANGGTVNPDNVTYVLEALNENYEPQRVLVSDKVLNYTLFYPTERGDQDIMRFGLYARNSAGKSPYTYLKVVTGAPYNLPYHESFATASTRGLCWQEGDALFGVTSEDSADDDLGALLCVPAPDGSASSFNLGKIVLQYALNPRLSFRMAGLAAGEKLSVRVCRPDGQEASLLTVDGPVDDWSLFTVDLSPIGRQRYIIPKFMLAEGNENAILLDDIVISDPYEADLGVIVRPSNTSADRPSVKVFMENVGLNSCSGAAVALYVDGMFVSRLYTDGAIAPGDREVKEVEIPVSDTDPKEVRAVVEWVYDLNPYNDVATTQFVMDESMPNHTAGLDGVTASSSMDAAVYGIDGRCVRLSSSGNLQPGIYIAGGKKIIVK